MHLDGKNKQIEKVGTMLVLMDNLARILPLHHSPLCRSRLLITSVHGFENKRWMNVMSCIYGALINDAPPWPSAP